MSQIDVHRMALALTLHEDYGLSHDVAAKAALALHPLDDSPVPSRRFEKEVRKASRRLGKALRKMKGEPHNAEEMVIQTLASYKQLAESHGESHYINRYDKALEPSDQ